MLLYPRQGKTSPGADLSIFPLKTKVCSIQTVNYRDISAAGISSIVFHHVTVLSSFLSLILITQRRRHSPFTGQKRRVWQKGCVKKHRVLPDQLSQVGMSQASDKQAAWVLQSCWKNNMTVPVSVPLGNRQEFLLSWVHAGAAACSFEATAIDLMQKHWLTSLESSCHLLDVVVQEQSMAKTLITLLITGLI